MFFLCHNSQFLSYLCFFLGGGGGVVALSEDKTMILMLVFY